MARDFQDKINKMAREGRATVYGPNMQPIDPGPEEPVVEKSPEDDKPTPTNSMDALKRMESQTPEEFEAELTKDIKALEKAGYPVDDSTAEEEEIFDEIREFDDKPKKKTPTREDVKQAKIGAVVQQAAIDYAKSKGVDLNNEAEADVFWANCSRVNPDTSLIEQIHEATSKTLRALGKSIPYDRPVSMGELIDKDRAKQKYSGGPTAHGGGKTKEEGLKTLDSIMDSVAKKRTM